MLSSRFLSFHFCVTEIFALIVQLPLFLSPFFFLYCIIQATFVFFLFPISYISNTIFLILLYIYLSHSLLAVATSHSCRKFPSFLHVISRCLCLRLNSLCMVMYFLVRLYLLAILFRPSLELIYVCQCRYALELIPFIKFVL